MRDSMALAPLCLLKPLRRFTWSHRRVQPQVSLDVLFGSWIRMLWPAADQISVQRDGQSSFSNRDIPSHIRVALQKERGLSFAPRQRTFAQGALCHPERSEWVPAPSFSRDSSQAQNDRIDLPEIPWRRESFVVPALFQPGTSPLSRDRCGSATRWRTCPSGDNHRLITHDIAQ